MQHAPREVEKGMAGNRLKWTILFLAILALVAYVSSYLCLVHFGRDLGWPTHYVFRYSDDEYVNLICYCFYYPCYAIDTRLRHVAVGHEPMGSLAGAGTSAPAASQTTSKPEGGDE